MTAVRFLCSPKPKKWEELQRLDWLLRVQSPSPKKKPEAHAEVRRSPDRVGRCVLLAARLRWLGCGVQAEREYAAQMQQETAEEAARRQRAQRHAMRARLRAAADSSNPNAPVSCCLLMCRTVRQELRCLVQAGAMS